MFFYFVFIESKDKFFYGNHNSLLHFMNINQEHCEKYAIQYNTNKIELYLISFVKMNYPSCFKVKEMNKKDCEKMILHIRFNHENHSFFYYHKYENGGNWSCYRPEEDRSYQFDFEMQFYKKSKGICQSCDCNCKVEEIGEKFCFDCYSEIMNMDENENENYDY
jgi:hypothetical protein